MKIQILGWYGHGNTGDEAYKLAFPSLLPDHELIFADVFNPDKDEPDAIILGGGDIVYPSFTGPLSKKPKIPKSLVSTTLTNASDLQHLKLFKKLHVRDYRSQKLGQTYADVKYLPDVTFMLQPDVEAGRQLMKAKFEAEGSQLRERVITIVFNAYTMATTPESYRRDFTNFQRLSQDIADAVDVMDASIVFMPFSTRAPWDDRTANSWVASHSRKYYKNMVIFDRLSVQDNLNLIAASNVVVSTRLHSSIFSTIAGVPFIDLTHHDKNRGFIETLGKTDWSMSLWEISINDFKKLLNTLLKRNGQDASLVEFTRKAREQLVNATLL